MTKKHLQLTNWAFVCRDNGYTPPELLVLRVSGICNHPDLPGDEEREVVSSKVLDIDHKWRQVETRNTIYYLAGPPHPVWEDEMKKQNRYDEYRELIEGQRYVN